MSFRPRTVKALDHIREHLASIGRSHITPGRALILEAVFKLLASEGYASISMRRVATAVNLKPSSIYSHFQNGRNEIISEALRWSYHGWGVEFLATSEKAENANDLWDALITVYVRRQLTISSHDVWDMLWAMDQISEFLPDDCRNEMRVWLSMIHELMRAIIVEMGFEFSEPSLRLVISVLDSATSWCGWSKKPEDLPYHINTAKKITRMILQRKDVFDATT
ncbi:TetR/AcrR family transcriptional regulator [Agrobacterium sp. CCNWLW71]|uniref:TetR/AcrR family transcriptional regulator n=1 Tax=unclassified Agrobacterium TaxID=2632611 RepID=UPI002FF2EBFB